MDRYKPYREALRILTDRVLLSHSNEIRKETGFVLSRIINCQLIFLKFNPIGSAYQPLPKHLASKKAIINVHNYDQRCFGYAGISALKVNVPEHHRSEAKSTLKSISLNLDLIRLNILFQCTQFQNLKRG